MRADFIEENWCTVAEDDMSVQWLRENSVYEFQTPEFGFANDRAGNVFFPEFASVAVRENGQLAKIDVLFAVGEGGDAENVARVGAFDDICDGTFDDGDVRFAKGYFS